MRLFPGGAIEVVPFGACEAELVPKARAAAATSSWTWNPA